MKRIAFTLSEVLIALGIIGVVAALTLPNVINKYREHATVTKVKKFYSLMNQAYLLSVKDNGFATDWNVGNGENGENAIKVVSYLKPYMKVLRDCGTGVGCLGYKEKVNLLNGAKHNINYDSNDNYYKMILLDGSYFILRTGSTYCGYSDAGWQDVCANIFTDINGGKEPNTVGKDIFAFVLTKDGVRLPNISLSNETGWASSFYIIINGNMNYLYK